MQNKHFTRILFNLIPTILFIILTTTVSLRPAWIKSYDTFISSLIHSLRSPGLTDFFKNYTKIGNTIPMIILCCIIFIVLIFKKNYQASFFFISSILLGTGINHLLKNIIQRHRPLIKLIKIDGYSFPSGHSVAAMVLFGSLILIATHSLKSMPLKIITIILGIILMILLALSRIYLNVHYPTDVTAGLLLGFITLQVTSHLFYRKDTK